MNKFPKQAHFYWGYTPMPWLNALSLYSFRRHNPDWKVILYSPTGLSRRAGWKTGEQSVPYSGVDYAGSAWCIESVDEFRIMDYEGIGMSNDMHDVHRADALRHYIMYTEGGLWSDMDILYFAPVGRVAPDGTDVALSFHMQLRKKPYYATAFVLTAPRTKFYQTVYEKAVQSWDPNLYQCIGPDMVRKLWPRLDDARQEIPSESFYNIPVSVVYPFLYGVCDRFFSDVAEDSLPPDSIGVHWYGGSPNSGKYQTLLTPESLHRYGRTLAGRLIRRMI